MKIRRSLFVHKLKKLSEFLCKMTINEIKEKSVQVERNIVMFFRHNKTTCIKLDTEK